MNLTSSMWKRIEDYFCQPCELNERGEIVYEGRDFEVGYIATGDYAGWLVDKTGDVDRLVFKL
jgi:hypothetical protein